MTSPAQRIANAKNAQKSRGATSLAGKRRLSMNAIKHGLTAKAVLLPDEDPGEFRDMMVGWFDALKPCDQFEVSLVEVAVCANWRFDRVTRAHSARLCLNAQTWIEERKNRESRESMGLLLRLLRAPHGRPTALPLTEQAQEKEEADTTPREFDVADHPSLLIGAMVESESGCLALDQLWRELRENLEHGPGCWGAPERFRVFRLLGIHPIDAYITVDLASMLQACQVLDPDAGSLVGEVWNEFVSAEALTALEKRYQAVIAHLARPDQDGARAYLMEIVARETNWLAEKIQSHQERAELEAHLETPSGAFDDSREGQLLRRYEASCEKHYRRCLDELYRWRAEKRRRIEKGENGRYFLPSPRWFEEVEGRNHSFKMDELAEIELMYTEEETGHPIEEEEAFREQPLEGSVALASGSMPIAHRVDDVEDRAAAAALSERDERDRIAECVASASAGDAGEMSSERARMPRGNQEAVVTAGADDLVDTGCDRQATPRADLSMVRGAIGRTVARNGSNRERKRLRRLERERLRQEGRPREVALAGG
jgi:hypothetical protein